jgi:iron complex transport system substrate-binding protein
MLAGPACAGPARILSLNPCTDAILVQLADPVQITALSSLSSDPVQSSMDVGLARRLPSTDGTLEEVVARRPDLVLGSSFTPPATRAAMARLGLRMEPFGIAANVAESEAQIRRIGTLVGHRDRAEALVGRIEAALAAAAPPPGMRPIPTLMWQGGGMVPGRDTLMHDLMTRVGLSNFSADKGLRQSDLLPLEALVADPPRLLLVVARAGRMGIMTGCCRILCWGISPEWLVCGLIPILNFAAVRRLSVRWRRLRPHVMGYRVAGRRGAGQFRAEQRRAG